VRPYWSDERHGLEIYHGDCLEVMPELEREFDLCLTDPPYGKGKGFAGEGLQHDDWYALIQRAVQEAYGVSDCLLSFWPTVGLRDAMTILPEDPRVIVWNKTNQYTAVSSRGFLYTWTPLCLWGQSRMMQARQAHREAVGRELKRVRLAKGLTTSSALQAIGRPATGLWSNWEHGLMVPNQHDRKAIERLMGQTFDFLPPGAKQDALYPDVFSGPVVIPDSNEDTAHPTQKPLWLLLRLIRAIGGDRLLDPFLGSGTTLVACYRLGRWGIGIEISEQYCELAAKRLEREIAQGRLWEPAELDTVDDRRLL